jgi:excisionase family DNA binding protein
MAGFAFCAVCQTEVDWVKVPQAAAILNVSKRRVRQLIHEGRFPGALEYAPPDGDRPFWKIPLASLQAYMEARSTA